MIATVGPRLVRQHVLELRPVAHGSVGAAELAPFGLTPADVLDFSVNTNPLGPSPTVLRAVQDTDWTRYPGDHETPLRAGLARQCGTLPDNIALGNGSAELLWLIAVAVLQPGDQVAVMGPTFGEYARAARTVGAHVTQVEAVTDIPPARLAFVCNPNNPTGALVGRRDIELLLQDLPDRVVVLDEAYAAFAAERWRSEDLLTSHPNLIILRSLTKDHALPGLRLGYLLASSELASAVEAVRPPWSVNTGALRAGLATLEPEAYAHVEWARSVVATSRALLTDGLTALGYAVRASAANFVLVNVGDAAAFRRTLLPHGIVVRDCTSFGLPTCVRIACRLPEQCALLIDVVTSLRQDETLAGLNST